LIRRIPKSNEAVQGPSARSRTSRLASNGKKRARKRERGHFRYSKRQAGVARIACFTIMYVARRAPSGRTFIERTNPQARIREREEKKLSIRGVEDWRASGMRFAGIEGERGPVWRTRLDVERAVCQERERGLRRNRKVG